MPVRLAGCLAVLTLAAGITTAQVPDGVRTNEPPPVAASRLSAPGIENFFRLSPGLYSGAQPEGDAAFAALRGLGVRTIISVDGTPPDLARARRHGIQYVHLPIGYDGIPDRQEVLLAKAIESLPGPVFVHCHHGKHRGPAAAAVCAMTKEGWDRPRALAWLRQAGTDPNYSGLFATVEQFRPPTAQTLAAIPRAELPEKAPLPKLVETMVQVDELWDRLKAEPPGTASIADATLLTELLRESTRNGSIDERGPAFRQRMTAAATEVEALATALRAVTTEPRDPVRQAAVTAARDRIQTACKQCHAANRDRKPAPQPAARRPG